MEPERIVEQRHEICKRFAIARDLEIASGDRLVYR
jgi:hypothetical protein